MIHHRWIQAVVVTGIIFGLSIIQFGCAPKPMKTAMVEQPAVTEEEATVEKHSAAVQPSLTPSTPSAEPQTIIETKTTAEPAASGAMKMNAAEPTSVEPAAVPEKPVTLDQTQLAAAPAAALSTQEKAAPPTMNAAVPMTPNVPAAPIASVAPPAPTSVQKVLDLKSRYTVKPGDSLWWIARYKDVYNNPSLWPVIYQANAKKIKDPNKIFPGQTFVIPRGDAKLKSFKKTKSKTGAPRPSVPPAGAKLPVK